MPLGNSYSSLPMLLTIDFPYSVREQPAFQRLECLLLWISDGATKNDGRDAPFLSNVMINQRVIVL